MPRGKRAMNREDVLTNALDIQPSVQCSVCGKTHLATSEDFITIYGNITVGSDGGIVGDNLDEKGVVVKATVLCRTEQCTKQLCDKISKKGTTR